MGAMRGAGKCVKVGAMRGVCKGGSNERSV